MFKDEMYVTTFFKAFLIYISPGFLKIFQEISWKFDNHVRLSDIIVSKL